MSDIKINLTHAKIMMSLNDLPTHERTVRSLTKELFLHKQYLYQELRQLADWGLIKQVKRGRSKFYEPTATGLDLSVERIKLEKEKQLAILAKEDGARD